MTRKQIIYDNLLRLLKFLTAGNHFDEYYGQLGEDQQTRLLKISEDLEVEISSIQHNKDSNLIEFSFGILLPLLERFSDNFSDYPNNRLNEIFILIEFLSKLNDVFNDSISIDDADDLINIEEEEDVTNFSFVLVSKPIHAKNFVYYDTNEILNSVCLLDLANRGEIHNLLERPSMPIELIFQLLAKIGIEGSPLHPLKYVLIRSELENKPSLIWACLAMHIVKNGDSIHQPYQYTLSPQVIGSRRITSGKEYQQFTDSLVILSEYNEKKDLLDKYIRLYHVIENFMYKFPLVKLERSHNGSVFSIRDFQRMYDKIKTSETTALTKLFKRICDEEYNAGQNFGDFIVTKWQALSPAIIPNVADIDSLLSALRITKKRNDEDIAIAFSDFTINNPATAKFFSAVIYGFRNSLVHNRETEFHLTYETILNHPVIGDCAKKIMEHFLIPVIVEIIFFLITNENDIVWFQGANLVLFEKN